MALLGAGSFSAAKASPVGEAGPRTALVLSEATYPDADAPMTDPETEGKALAETLQRHGFAVQSVVNAGGATMAEAIERLVGTIRPGSIAVFVFAGAGIAVAGKNYLIPVDARVWSEADVVREGTSVDKLVQSMADHGATGAAVILDASRRNPFERRFRSVSAGLAPMTALPGTLSIISTAPGTLVDSGPGETAFAADLVKAIDTTGIDAEQAFVETRMEVAALTHNQQVPAVVSGLDVPFFFGVDQGGKPPSAPVAPPVSARTSATLPVSAARPQNPGSDNQPEAVSKPLAASAPQPASPPRAETVPQGTLGDTPGSGPVSPAPPAPAPAPAAAAAVLPTSQTNTSPSSAPSSRPAPRPAPASQVAALPPPAAVESTSIPQPATGETPMSTAEKEREAELATRIDRDPRDEDAVFERGRLLAQHGRYTSALQDFDRAITLNPNDADAFNDRCWTRSMANQLQPAMEDCDRALKLRPNFADAHDSRGLVLMKRGSTEAAVADYDAAIRLDPKQSSALYGRGIAELRLGQREAAEKDISSAVALDPGVEGEYARYGLK